MSSKNDLHDKWIDAAGPALESRKTAPEEEEDFLAEYVKKRGLIVRKPKPRKKAPYVAKVSRYYRVDMPISRARLDTQHGTYSFHLTPKQARELQALLDMVVEPATANIPASKPAKRQNTGTKAKR